MVEIFNFQVFHLVPYKVLRQKNEMSKSVNPIELAACFSLAITEDKTKAEKCVVVPIFLELSGVYNNKCFNLRRSIRGTPLLLYHHLKYKDEHSINY